MTVVKGPLRAAKEHSWQRADNGRFLLRAPFAPAAVLGPVTTLLVNSSS
jgi:hypothetical protein